jgi:hypothetical protein
MMLTEETKSLKDMTVCKQKQGTRQTKIKYLEGKMKSITIIVPEYSNNFTTFFSFNF